MIEWLNRSKIFCTEEKQLFKAPDAPSTVIEALNQRLEKYKSAEEQAKAEGNTSKGRRMGRIVKVLFMLG